MKTFKIPVSASGKILVLLILFVLFTSISPVHAKDDDDDGGRSSSHSPWGCSPGDDDDDSLDDDDAVDDDDAADDDDDDAADDDDTIVTNDDDIIDDDDIVDDDDISNDDDMLDDDDIIDDDDVIDDDDMVDDDDAIDDDDMVDDDDTVDDDDVVDDDDTVDDDDVVDDDDTVDDDDIVDDDDVIDDDDAVDDDDIVDDDDAFDPLVNVSVDTWQWNAPAAISLTCDEGLDAPYLYMMPEVESRGWRMTFFVYTEQPYWEETWPLIQQAYANGHEVASHTYDHANLTTLDEEQIRSELEIAIADLKDHIDPNMEFPSFAYTYELYNDLVKAVVGEYHRYARAGDGGVPVPPNPVPLNDPTTPDMLALEAKANVQDVPVSNWNMWVTEAVAQGKWLIEEYHGICSDEGYCNGWEPRTLAEFQEHFDHIQSFDNIWVAPMGDVGKYIEERNNVEFSATDWNKNGVKLMLTIANSDIPTDIPLTFVLTVPLSWPWLNLVVTQGGEDRTYEMTGSNQYRIEALPNGEPLLIRPHE